MPEIEQRLARIESRLVQLMLHFNLNPYEKTYDARKSAAHPQQRKFLSGRR